MNKNWDVQEEFAEITVNSWGDLVHVLETSFLDWSEFIFRGQGDAGWPLRSKFDRDYQRMIDDINAYNQLKSSKMKGLITLKPRRDLLDEHLKRFRTNAVGRRGSNPTQLNEIELLALGQHFGLSTPLLDWSKSPYVALYFALTSQTKPSSDYHALWVFSPLAFRDLYDNQNCDSKYEEDRLQFVDDALCEDNQRVINQSGVFTLTPNGDDLDVYINQSIKLKGYAPVLYKIQISYEMRDDFLRHLESMNVHSGTLFPDLIGAAELSNRQLEREKTLLLRRKSTQFSERLFRVNLCH